MDVNRNRNALYFNLNGDKRNLNNVWLNPDKRWNDNWFFLVLATSGCSRCRRLGAALYIARPSAEHPTNVVERLR